MPGTSATNTLSRASDGSSTFTFSSSSRRHESAVAPLNTALPRFAARHITFDPSQASSLTGSDKRYSPSANTTSTRAPDADEFWRIRRNASRAPDGVRKGRNDVPSYASSPLGLTYTLTHGVPATAAHTTKVAAKTQETPCILITCFSLAFHNITGRRC